MDHTLGIERPSTSFQSGAHMAKRSRFLENGLKTIEVKIETQPNESDKLSAMAQSMDLYSREAESVKAGALALSRKSNDSPAVVPIKKRRIQMLEVTRSPSPSPCSPSQQATSSQSFSTGLSPPLGEIRTSLSSSSSLFGFSSASSPRSSVPIHIPSSMSETGPPPASHMQPLACEGGDTEKIEKAEVAHTIKLDLKEQPFANLGKCFDNKGGISARQGCTEEINGQHLQDTGMDGDCKSDGQLLRPESDSVIRDDRLHWDLNTDMTAWDASTEQGTIENTEGKDAAVRPPRSQCVDAAGTNHKEMNVGCNEDIRGQLEEGPDYGEEESGIETFTVELYPVDGKGVVEEVDTGEEVSEEVEAGEHAVDDSEMRELCEEDLEIGEQMDEKPEIAEQDISENAEHQDIEKCEATPPSVYGEGALNAAETHFPGKPGSWDADIPSDGMDVHELSETCCHQGDMPERLKVGKQGKSSSDDAEGWNYEPELEEHVDYGDSDCRDADDPGRDVDDKTSLMQAESNWIGDDLTRPQTDTSCEGEVLVAGESQRLSLPDGEEPVSEPSLERHRSSGRSRTTGWDQLPEGFDSAEEALKAAKEVSAQRGGRGSSWSSAAGRGSSHSANRYGPLPIRSNSRDGFSSARGDSYYGERHPDEAMYDRDGFRHGRRADENFNVRGREPSRRPGIFARGRVGGWMDSQPSHMNQWGSGRQRPGSGFSGPVNAAAMSAGRNENSGFVGASDVTVAKHGMGPGRGGIRSTISGGGMGRGCYTRGPPVDMDGRVHYHLRAGAGADRVAGLGAGARPRYSGNMHDRGGRGMEDMYRGGGMESRRSLSPRRQHPLGHPNFGRMPGMRPDSRPARSRTPPPNHRSMGSEFNAARNQRSPPQSSRWSNDRREADSYQDRDFKRSLSRSPPPSSRWFGEKRGVNNFQDRDFKRPLSRICVPSQRASPYVAHGTFLTNEPAGSGHSPTSKNFVAAPSHLRKSKDDSLDCRPSKQIEEDEARYAGSFVAKDREYRSSLPRECDREREKGSFRRERDRDDERRQDFRRSLSRDDRIPGGPKHSGTWEADDDVAPRRRRPS